MKKIGILILILFQISCGSPEEDYKNHLNNGLESFENTREVNGNLIEGLSIKKIAFIKKSKEVRVLVLKLNDNATKTDVENYTWAIHNYIDKEQYSTLLKGKEYVSTPVKAKLEIINDHKYIITNYELDIKRLEQIQFFLYDREKFIKVLSKRVTVKNIGI